MKKAYLILLISSFFISNCNKTKDKTTDYRDKYIGDYQCKKTGDYFCGDSVYNFDIIEKINVSKFGDSMIKIFDASIKLKPNSEFGGGLYPDPAYHGFGGYFKSDSMFFDTYQGGLGCFTSLNYKGKKQ